jgi:hypothetical protein
MSILSGSAHGSLFRSYGALSLNTTFPRLAPWAAFVRRFAACAPFDLPDSHSSTIAKREATL